MYAELLLSFIALRPRPLSHTQRTARASILAFCCSGTVFFLFFFSCNYFEIRFLVDGIVFRSGVVGRLDFKLNIL